MSADSQSESVFAKPQVIIRRTAHIKPHLRTRLPEDEAGPSTPPSAPCLDETSDILATPPDREPPDELVQIRTLLRPPPISGLSDWGIPPEPIGSCNPDIEAKLSQFHDLKRDPVQPRHFNDSLMSNRSFRNPHLYAKLVEFVDVDERTTNFPKHIWDPNDVKDEWFADKIAEYQKSRSEQQQANAGKRSHLDFTPASSHSTAPSLRSTDRDVKRGRYQRQTTSQYYSKAQQEKDSRWK